MRAEIFVSGYVFKQLDEHRSQITYVVQADPKGIIPGEHSGRGEMYDGDQGMYVFY